MATPYVLLHGIIDGPFLLPRHEFYDNLWPSLLRGFEPFNRYQPQHGTADIHVTEIYDWFMLNHMHAILMQRNNEYMTWASQFDRDRINEDAPAVTFDWSAVSIHQLYQRIARQQE